MFPQHIGPQDAVEVHKLVKAKKSIGIHWGTYQMGTNEVIYLFIHVENWISQRIAYGSYL